MRLQSADDPGQFALQVNERMRGSGSHFLSRQAACRKQVTRYTAGLSVGKCQLKCTETRQHGVGCLIWYRGTADDLSLHSVNDDGHVISDSPIKGSLNSGTSRTPDV